MGEGGRKKPGRRESIPWLKIRTDYLQGETELTALAKKHGTTRVSIWRRMKADKAEGREWASSKDIRNAVVTDVTQRIATRVAQEQGAELAKNLLRHPGLETLLLDFSEDTLRKMMAGGLRPGKASSEAEERKAAIETVIKALDASRTLHGLTPGKPSIAESNNEEPGKVYEVVVRPAESA